METKGKAEDGFQKIDLLSDIKATVTLQRSLLSYRLQLPCNTFF